MLPWKRLVARFTSRSESACGPGHGLASATSDKESELVMAALTSSNHSVPGAFE